MAEALTPIWYCLAFPFLILLFLLIFPPYKRTDTEQQISSLTVEINLWHDQADTYLQAEDWTGFFGAVSRINEITERLMNLIESQDR